MREQLGNSKKDNRNCAVACKEIWQKNKSVLS